MKKNKLTVPIFLTLLMLNACSTISESMSDGKRKSSDEFLVEKKAPLVLPPSFGELPEPREDKEENSESIEEKKLSIEKIVSQSSTTEIGTENKKLDKSIEKSIIEKINEK